MKEGAALPCTGSPRPGDAWLVRAGRPLNLAFHSFEARHACNRAASSSSGIGLWAYLAVFAATAAGYMGIPIIGTAATGAAAGPAGRLNPGSPGISRVPARASPRWKRPAGDERSPAWVRACM